MTFKQWMHAVDATISDRCGLTSNDLADICYRDLYDDEVSPMEAAYEALANEGYPVDGDGEGDDQ